MQEQPHWVRGEDFPGLCPVPDRSHLVESTQQNFPGIFYPRFGGTEASCLDVWLEMLVCPPKSCARKHGSPLRAI